MYQKKLKPKKKRLNGSLSPVKTWHRLRQPTLRFTPTAWAKLRFLRDLGPTEVGAFGISADPNDLLCIHDIALVKQECTEVSVEFDDLSVAAFFEDRIEAGLRPEQIGRVWIHTHPGDSPHPSGVDEKTFERCFGQCDWAIMFIIARNDATYARIRWRHPAAAELEIPVSVEFSKPFAGSNQAQWEREYIENVHDVSLLPISGRHWDEFDMLDDWWLPGDDVIPAPLSQEVAP